MPLIPPLARPRLRTVATFAAVTLTVLGVFSIDLLDSRRQVLERASSSSDDLCRLLVERLDGALRESGTREAALADAAVFIRELDALALGGGRFVAVAGSDGTLIMRRPGAAGTLGPSERDEDLRALISAAAAGGDGAGEAAGTGKYLYSSLAGQRGFIVVVGEARADLLGDWRRKVAAYTISFAIIAALMALLGMGLLKDYARNSELAARLVAMESASDMIVIADLEGRAEYVNSSFERTTGVARDLAAGSRTAIFGPREDAAAEALATAAAGGQWRGEISAVRPSGEEYVEEVAVSPVPGPDGSPLRVVAIKRDVTERRRFQERLELLAHYDSLTGLPNRALFFDRLGGAVARGRRENRKFALLFVDLDGFKAINDHFGHGAGDELLVETAKRLGDAIRDSDTAGRMGGDEFIVLLDNISRSEDAAVFAAKIRAALSAPVALSSGDVVSIGASVGSAVFPDDGDDGESVLKAADSAMYALKMKAAGER